MKLKNNQSKNKGNANGVQKGNIVKKQKNEVAVKQAKAVVAKNAKQLKEDLVKTNKNQKMPKKALPPKKVVEEDDDDDEEEDDEEMEQEEVEESSENGEDSGADVEADADNAASDDEEDSDGEEVDEDDESDDENQEEADEQEEDENSDEDNDEPAEEPIRKKGKAQETPKQIGIPKIKCGEVAKDVPNEKVIVVRRLPKKGQFKQVDLIEIFGKYGTLHTIKPFYYKDAPSVAHIAFTSTKAAKAALAADKTEINGSVIQVAPRPASKSMKLMEEKKKKYEEEAGKRKQFEETGDRSLFIKNLKPGTTEALVRKHFEPFGEIEMIKVVPRNLFPYGFITYTDASSAHAALKLHNSVLNNSTIRVYLNGDQNSKFISKDPKRTVILKNCQKMQSCPGDKIEAIFAKCGQIENIDIICSRNVLAFIVFKNEDSVLKAIELSGTTEDDLKLEVVEYVINQKDQNTTVFMANVKPGVSEEEIREFFAETGEISSVFLKMNFAIVKFANTDGFCKSFLLNEHKLAGQMVFLEPYSQEKIKVMKPKHHLAKKRKFQTNKKEDGLKKSKLHEE